jgi:hypothetical protein
MSYKRHQRNALAERQRSVVAVQHACIRFEVGRGVQEHRVVQNNVKLDARSRNRLAREGQSSAVKIHVK